MTAAPRLRLKRSSGWFAAGREVESALHPNRVLNPAL
jgi:hypothetical protein